MANGKNYTILGSNVRMVLDKMQNLVEVIEVRFTFGENNEAIVTVKKENASPDAIKQAIYDYIALFDGI